MLLRCILLISALLIGTCALAQEDSPDLRLVPETETLVIDAPYDAILDSTGVFIMVEEMPEFPGGTAALFTYMSEHINYPEEALERHLEGMVLLTFIVEKDGTVSDARVLRGIGGGCDQEALRVARQMPTWTPGRQGGQPVRVQFSLPVRFTMAD